MRFVTAPLLAALAMGLVAPAQADTLLDNIAGVTFDKDGRIVQFSAMVIDRDGRIAQVLGHKDKRPKSPDYKIDGQGRFVIPGLIDSHIHLMPMALAALAAESDQGLTSTDLPKARPDDRDVAFGKVQRQLAALGITAIADMGTTIEDWQTYRRAGDNGTLYMRIMAYAADIPAMALIAGPKPTPWLYQDTLRLNGVHFALDGSFTTRSAALKSPYADAPGQSGKSALDETKLRNLMSRALMDGFQVAVTAHGDAALETATGAIAELSDSYTGDRRWRVEGIEIADASAMAGLETRNVTFSFTPDRLAEHSRIAPDRLGPSRVQMVQPWKTLQSAKANITFGSGDTWQPAAPLRGMAAAITREDVQGQPLGGWQPQERLLREDALAAYTTDAARAGFADGHFGRLEKGERADFVMLESDPMLASPAELRQLRVLETWIGGRKIYDASKPPPAALNGPGQSLREPPAPRTPAAPAPGERQPIFPSPPSGR